jgi:hypothetical protein
MVVILSRSQLVKLTASFDILLELLVPHSDYSSEETIPTRDDGVAPDKTASGNYY